MILKQKPIDQKSDDELEKDLKKVTGRDSWLHRNSHHINHGIAVGLFAAGYYTMTGLWALGTASSSLPLMLCAMVSGPAIWALGAIGCAVGFTRIGNKLSGLWRSKAKDITKEKEVRAFKKTPAYQEVLRHAAEEAVRIKDNLKKAFNAAVEKAFHTGTENTVEVKKPLQLKKQGAEPAPAPKKKSFLGMKL